MTKFTADVVAVDPDGRVLLIQRKWAPFAGCWALPGGHLDEGEDSLDAAVRELEEETTLSVGTDQLAFIGTYDAPGRDPRGPYSTDAYLVRVPAGTTAAAHDDAEAVRWVSLEEVAAQGSTTAFDHGEILRDALIMVRP